MKYFPNDAAFFAERGGKASEEKDFGVNWMRECAYPKFRVSVIKATGDVYAKNQDTGSMLLLGTIAADDIYAEAERRLGGWADLPYEEKQLSWVVDRLK